MRTIAIVVALSVFNGGPAAAMDVPLEVPGNHGGFLHFAFSPDGTRVAGGTGTVISTIGGREEVAGGEVILWNTRTGRILLTLGNHGASVHWVAFSADGAVLASASDGNGVLKVWDGKTGDLRQTLKLPDELGSSSNGGAPLCALSADGKSIAAVAVKRMPMGRTKVRTGDELIVWDTATGKPRWHLAGSNIHALAFSADGATLAAFAMRVDWKPSTDGASATGARTDQRFVAWDAATGKERFGVEANRSTPGTLAFVPGVGLVAVDGRKLLQLDPAAGISVKEIELATKSSLRGLAFSPDGRRFAAGKLMGDGIEWGETATGKITGAQEFKAQRFTEVAFSADLKRAAGLQKFTPIVIDLAPALVDDAR